MQIEGALLIMKKKYLFISNIASPYQVKFCYALQEYFDAEFWFYDYIDETRPEWWKIPLGEKCKIMRCSGRFPKIGYYSLGLFASLIRFKPDIVILGGFMKWHILAGWLAKVLGAKVAVMSEPLRYVKNDDDKSNELMNRNNSMNKIIIIKRMFGFVDLYIGMGETAENQFLKEFMFPKEKVCSLRYPQDIADYYNHPLRSKERGDSFIILFANRLVARYQPIFVLEVFRQLLKKHHNVNLMMNSEGPLKQECLDYIGKNNLTNVKFLDTIDSWNNMHLVYKDSDILILPATYSNGNGTIIEARASGMGVVISNKINHIEQHSFNNKNCFICELKVEEFVDAISHYIEDPQLLINHGLLSRETVEFRKNTHIAKLYFETFKKYRFID